LKKRLAALKANDEKAATNKTEIPSSNVNKFEGIKSAPVSSSPFKQETAFTTPDTTHKAPFGSTSVGKVSQISNQFQSQADSRNLNSGTTTKVTTSTNYISKPFNRFGYNNGAPRPASNTADYSYNSMETKREEPKSNEEVYPKPSQQISSRNHHQQVQEPLHPQVHIKQEPPQNSNHLFVPPSNGDHQSDDEWTDNLAPLKINPVHASFGSHDTFNQHSNLSPSFNGTGQLANNDHYNQYEHERQPEYLGQDELQTPNGIAQNSPNVNQTSNLTAVAVYDYRATDVDEISFDPDDIITNIVQVDEGWWQGSCHGRFGLFPANYVQLRQN